ncbi:hypothetical protein G9A89_000750 [Geosiphon pyriformis]|nr:hypothetical protein G9A89_000750 [Geosiphon pyriformis]
MSEKGSHQIAPHPNHNFIDICNCRNTLCDRVSKSTECSYLQIIREQPETNFSSIQDDKLNKPNFTYYLDMKSMVNFDELKLISLWREAFIDGLGTFFLMFFIGALEKFITPTTFPIPVTIIALIPIITLLVIIVGPISAISLRVCSIPRGILYVAFQLCGGTIGAFLISLLIDEAKTSPKSLPIGLCHFDKKLIDISLVLIGEMIFSLGLACGIFALALNPNRKIALKLEITGFVISIIIGILAWISMGLNAGWPG